LPADICSGKSLARQDYYFVTAAAAVAVCTAPQRAITAGLALHGHMPAPDADECSSCKYSRRDAEQRACHSLGAPVCVATKKHGWVRDQHQSKDAPGTASNTQQA
jgi:hypothetical protein